MSNEPIKPAGARPWHLEIGWDGAKTAIVDAEGYLVAECEGPRHGYTLKTDHDESEGNARLIVEAVNAYEGRLHELVSGRDPYYQAGDGPETPIPTCFYCGATSWGSRREDHRPECAWLKATK